jgi:hypothetical protein
MKRNLLLSCVNKEQSHSTKITSQSARDRDIYRERATPDEALKALELPPNTL